MEQPLWRGRSRAGEGAEARPAPSPAWPLWPSRGGWTGRLLPGESRWTGSSSPGCPGRVRLQFGQPQVGGGLLLFPGSWRLIIPPPSLLLFFQLSLSGLGVRCVQKSACNARGSPGGAAPGSLSPPPLAAFPPLWPHPGRSSPPPTLPLSLPPRLILTSGRESRALSCLPAGPSSHRARRAAVLLPLLSPPLPSHSLPPPGPLPPPGATPAHGLRAGLPLRPGGGSPPAPQRLARPSSLLPSRPIHLLLCCSLSLLPSPRSQLLSPRRCADEDFWRRGRLALPASPAAAAPRPRPRCRSPCGPWSR